MVLLESSELTGAELTEYLAKPERLRPHLNGNRNHWDSFRDSAGDIALQGKKVPLAQEVSR